MQSNFSEGASRIVVLATGGTLAGTAVSPGDNVGYRAAQIGIALLDHLGLRRIDGRGEQPGSHALQGVAQRGSRRCRPARRQCRRACRRWRGRRPGRCRCGCACFAFFSKLDLANLSIIPALMSKGDVIFADKLVHACILDAAQLSGARLIRFAHNDTAHLAAQLKAHRTQFPQALIVTDHVFSMDGDVAPLADIAALAAASDAWTMVDDAHGLGIVPAAAPMDIWMGTLSKAVGSYGGYVVGSQALVDFLVTRARSLVFSTGLPPSVCASAHAALGVMEAEPWRGARALAFAQRVTEALGLPRAQSAIVPILLGTPERALAAAAQLQEAGLQIVAGSPRQFQDLITAEVGKYAQIIREAGIKPE